MATPPCHNETGLRAEMRNYCRDIHNQIVRHPLSRSLSIKIFPLHPQSIRDHLEQKLVYMKVLEDLLEELKTTVWAQNDHLVGICEFFAKIYRYPSIQATIAYLDQQKGTRARDVMRATEAYSTYLRQLSTVDCANGIKGAYILGHAYVNLLDGLFGGVPICNAVGARVGFDCCQYLLYPFLYAAGTSIQETSKIVEPFVHQGFETHLDAIPWTPEDRQRLAVEAHQAYVRLLAIQDDLLAADPSAAPPAIVKPAPATAAPPVSAQAVPK
ncbi:hypothetical protein PAPYR_6627 [Paratrimastix pyriformis]|uniref:Uncharacterized protein n=1 Tax=Paratrimastix pyriformis TaxID=342808 RepID=A0ABQ8UEV8_9EUKA|nr:hypothetical protein PAPYR_6627 [Paratrimastix pyriformis]